MLNFNTLEVGYDIPARPGMTLSEVATPCLALDMEALERNILRMRNRTRAFGVAHRAHGKMHRSADVAQLQMRLGGAVGLCCQKVSEAEAFVRAGITDVLISNEVRDPRMTDRLAMLARRAKVQVCLDDPAAIADLSAAAVKHGAVIGCLVEMDCAGRCGVAGSDQALELATAIAAAPGLQFAGLQAYHGSAQHLQTHAERAGAIAAVTELVSAVIRLLNAHGLPCETVTGGGTGTFALEAASGVFTEVQCGSYAFMDADYGRIQNEEGQRLDSGEWENALFVLSRVMSRPAPGRAVCDAGLKSLSAESGLPLIRGRGDLNYASISDEHGVIEDPRESLRVGDMLHLIPGHCDPTCNLHDWYAGLRGGRVECLWPVTARGKSF